MCCTFIQYHIVNISWAKSSLDIFKKICFILFAMLFCYFVYEIGRNFFWKIFQLFSLLFSPLLLHRLGQDYLRNMVFWWDISRFLLLYCTGHTRLVWLKLILELQLRDINFYQICYCLKYEVSQIKLRHVIFA